MTAAVARTTRRLVRSAIDGGPGRSGVDDTDPGWTRESERQFLHETVLQTLEAVCAPDSHTRIDLLRQQAARDARKLRAYLAGCCPSTASNVGTMLEDLVTEAGYKGLSVDVIHEGTPSTTYALTPHVLACLRLAAAEALANTAKHSGVTSATLRHVATGDGLALSIADAGCGFDPADPARRDGFGLAHAIAGIGRVGGSATIDTTPGGGTLVYLTVPFARSDRHARKGERPWSTRSIPGESH